MELTAVLRQPAADAARPDDLLTPRIGAGGRIRPALQALHVLEAPQTLQVLEVVQTLQVLQALQTLERRLGGLARP
jgi:hypothetical protein